MKYIALALTALAVVLLQQLYSQDQTTRNTVKAVCDYSRSVSSGELETACGKAQDSSHSEYMCDSYQANAHCWVEMK